MKQKVPNIFSFATSELSQDAMFCWLLQWASPKYADTDPSLHKLGQEFVRLLSGKEQDFEISSIDVGRQWENIDIWAEINDDTFLLVEDKTGTTIHGGQLSRYKSSAEKEYGGKRSDLRLTYVKTGNEPLAVLRKVRQAGYRTVCRDEILKCLSEYEGSNQLVISYREHLQILEDATSSFKILPERKWGWNAWQGFYMELEKLLDIKSWDYVANPSGGFLGAWWHFVDVGDVSIYLQFEQGKLCFKIAYEGDENRSQVRDKFHSLLMSRVKDNFPEIHRPTRFGAGTYMTIAVVDEEDIFGEGVLNLEDVVNKLKRYEGLLDIFATE